MRMLCKEMSTDISLQRICILEIFPFRGKFLLSGNAALAKSLKATISNY